MKKIITLAAFITISFNAAAQKNADPNPEPTVGSYVEATTSTNATVNVGIQCTDSSGIEQVMYGTGADGRRYKVQTHHIYNSETHRFDRVYTATIVKSFPAGC